MEGLSPALGAPAIGAARATTSQAAKAFQRVCNRREANDIPADAISNHLDAARVAPTVASAYELRYIPPLGLSTLNSIAFHGAGPQCPLESCSLAW